MTQYFYAPKASQENTTPPEILDSDWRTGTGTVTVKLDASSVPYVEFLGTTDYTVAEQFWRITAAKDGTTIPQVADAEFYMELEFINNLTDPGSGDFRVCARADLAQSGYALGPRGSSLKIVSIVSGTRTDLLSQSIAITRTINTRYSVKAKLTGTTLETKFWETGTAEPAYQAAPANSAITSAGHVGIFSVFPDRTYVKLYKYSVATAGDPVLTEDPSSTPETRKGSTFTADKTGTLGTVTTATLNGVSVFDHLTAQDATTATFAGAFTDEITTSGEYNLVLGDGTVTEATAIQVNVVGLASFNINKDGADQGSLTDVEFLILTGAAGSRVINQQVTGITTTAGGDTGTIEITDTALAVGDTIAVAQQSPTVGGGVVHTVTLGLI